MKTCCGGLARLLRAIAFAGAITSLAAYLPTNAAGESTPSQPAGPAAPSRANCDSAAASYIASDPIRVTGKSAVDVHGVRYVPYGISIMGLQQWDALTPRVTHLIDNQIVAATTAWHANTVREQVSPFLAARYPRDFWRVLDHEVHLITCRNAIAVLNDNPMFTSREPNPTRADVRFDWMLARRYRNLHNVVIDVFNEPHLVAARSQRTFSADWMWHLWRWGGRVDGTQYVGIQTLIDAVRSAGNHNLIWAELPLWGYTSLYSFRRYPIRGANIEIEFHHPPLNNRAAWRRLLVPTGRPRVEGEESQYSSPGRRECDPQAPRKLPELLRALNRNHDGLIAWTLEPNVLLESALRKVVTDIIPSWFPQTVSELTHPNHMNQSYSCARLGQGMGSLVMHILRANASKFNPYAPVNRHVTPTLPGRHPHGAIVASSVKR